MTTDQLEQLATDILSANKKCLLSGSLALNRMGFKTMRLPQDIDIYCSIHDEFIQVDGMERTFFETDEDYVNEYFERFEYSYKGVKVDVFKPLDIYSECFLKCSWDAKCIAPHLIIGFKSHNAHSDTENSQKHKDDIVYFTQNN